ncbi:hypothetical protein [Paenibacillus mesotrionivorans]|jgi:hypothetical protein|uniref:Uncharacterized protein n=1 Tax=Paenibacillus mesotrionivorans TaxID=3160968 RepID=A0ACC7NX18_9BACL
MLKFKIAVCAGVFLAGLAAGWFLNTMLIPATDRNAAKPPSGDTLQSRALHMDYRQNSFKPREYIKVNRGLKDDWLPGER